LPQPPLFIFLAPVSRRALNSSRRDFRQQVKAQIAPTLEDGGDLSGGMEVLFAALRS
jgi:hypothetical protein